MENITDIVQIKHQVLTMTAKYAFNDCLYDDYDKIPYEMIEGIHPNFRCCVYREREIIRQRVRMAMGKLPTDSTHPQVDSAQVVHVIPCACEGCPISQITVTSNCRSCLAKKCVKACPFDAITTTPNGAVINHEKCRKCGKCVAACPYHAIVQIERPCIASCHVKALSIDEDNIAVINPDKCINCGACVAACPFGAISDLSLMTNVIDVLRSDKKKVAAMIAPSIEGQFGTASLQRIKQAILRLGFDYVYEVALGADMVACAEAEELIEHKQSSRVMTSSCCPAFVSMIHRHFPELVPLISTTVSPMVATERYIRSLHKEVVTVFIGPCIAKKHEAMGRYVDEIDYVLTFEELDAMLTAKEIDMEQEADIPEEATGFGRGFAIAGGVTEAVNRVLAEKGSEVQITTQKCSGADECRKALLLLKAGKLPADFIEGMSCVGGCMGGPATLTELQKSKKVFAAHKNIRENIGENVQETNFDKKQLHSK